MKHTIGRVFPILLILTITGKAGAHRLEPINTELAHSVILGHMILEADYGFFRFHRADMNENLLMLAVEVGMLPRTQFEIRIPYRFLDLGLEEGGSSHDGFGDVSLGLKYQALTETQWRPIVALVAEVGLPTGDDERELGEGKTEYALGLLADKTLGRFRNHLNIEYAVGVNGETENELEYRLASLYPVSEDWHVGGELVGGSNLTEDQTTLFLAPEVIWTALHNVELKLAVPLGVTDEAPDIGVQFQLAVESPF